MPLILIQISAKAVLAFIGAVAAYFLPTVPFIIVATAAVALDCLTAYTLSRRVRKKFPHLAERGAGKFQSMKLAKVGWTLIRIYLLIVLVFAIDKIIFGEVNLHLANIVSGAVCFAQVWSILENESSCNNAKWAQILQKIMVDKAERHLNIDINGDGKIDGRPVKKGKRLLPTYEAENEVENGVVERDGRVGGDESD